MAAPADDARAPVALVARRLQPLGRPVVFVGGAIITYLLDAEPIGGVRITYDVDVILEIETRRDLAAVEAELRGLGFRHDTAEGAPLCRWRLDALIVDVMATDPTIMGFGNRWYREAQATAEDREIEPGVVIKLIRAPYFLATKLEAFAGRGNDDFQTSRDIEDIIAVVDGRDSLLTEVELASPALRAYLRERFAALMGRPAFIEALPGHLRGDAASQARLEIVEERLRALATSVG